MAETLPLALRAPIPWPRTRLLGRQAELAAARAALLNDAAPLLTLVGPGGVGKTRLALAIAAAAESAFAHGVVWVDLAPVTDPALVPMALAVPLDILPSADLPLMEALSRHLRSRQILLLLDNCEHLLAPVAVLVSTLLAACPAVQSLATSRAPLRVRGEREFSVEPLPLPPPSMDDLEHLARNEAVALFVDRARAVRPAFTLTEANAPVVAELCRRLDGLPLAIEIAAARGRILSPEALLAQMTDRLRLLSGGHRDLPARQQTIEATIAWSYALLDDGPRDLFQRLAVFTDGCDLEAATAVAGGEPLDVLEALSALRDQGLLRTTEQPPHGNRYTMLEMVREYALARLEARDDAGTLRTAHAAHFLALAERANEAFRGPEMATWLNRLDADYPNLLAALGWLRERGDAEQVWRLVGALWRYWMLRARFAEGRQRVEEALTLPEIAGSVALARARLALAYFLVQTGDELARARELLDAALAVYREVGDQRGQASALEELMAVELNVGDLGRARARGEESLALYQALGDDYGSFNALWILAIVSMKMGDFALAHAELDRATRLAGALSPAFPRYLLRARGWLAVAEGDSRHAVCVFEEALAQARQIEFEPAMASLFDDLGWLAVWQRNWKRASNGFAEEVALGAKLSDDWHIARGMLGLAVVCADTGRPARAAWLFGAAESTTRVDVIDDDIYNPIRATYERAVALTRSALEAAAFDEGWQTGRALPRRQAIIRALSDAGGRDVSPEDAPADAVASYERLTRREAEVLRLVAQRQTDGEIADALYISRRTASSHVARILGKLGAANRREAGVVAASLGLI